mmetsp:Transcript_32951/g.49754  ORF Transcript_32951/g.49754 Transcript_32951/m.49754 type:complete len:93 (+) Transcript_32951:1002-1280(+)
MQALMGRQKEDSVTLTLFDAAEMAVEDSNRLEGVMEAADGLRKAMEEKGKAWEGKLKADCIAAASSSKGDPSVSWENPFMDKLKKDLDPLLR